jgi:adenine-specific DNA-methyltransferase
MVNSKKNKAIETPDRYSHVEDRKKEGAHYTPEIFADFISENIIHNSKLGKTIKIIDPAVGDGQLLLSLIKALKLHDVQSIEVSGFDTNLESLNITEQRIKNEYPDIELRLHNRDFLQVCLDKREASGQGHMFPAIDIPEFDMLIANPPYIRTQHMGAKQAKQLRDNFQLEGRNDIYQAFLIAMLAVLKPNGIAGVIVSNRFLSIKGAGKFRTLLHKQYEIKNIWDFGDTNVFDAAVLPVILILTPKKSSDKLDVPFTTVYKSENGSDIRNLPIVKNQIEALGHEGIVSSQNGNLLVKHGYLAFDDEPSDVWRLQDDESEAWLKKVADNTWCSFGDVGKIRVGVKTTADKIFIRSDWSSEIGYKPELLQPLTTHHVANRYHRKDAKLKDILYTNTVVGGKREAFDIELYPLSKKYLLSYEEQLSGRTYVAKSNRKWYEIWVPQDPSAWSNSKVVFRDITEKPMFWMDEAGTIVNGDCYWICRDNEDTPEDILWLILAIANSKFIEEYYDVKFGNKLYSNRRRFISQYVKQFPLPDPKSEESKKLITLAKKCYLGDEGEIIKAELKINNLVWSVFGLSAPKPIKD